MNACVESPEKGGQPTIDPTRDKGRLWIAAGLLATSTILYGLHLVVAYPRSHGAILYAVPVLLAAWLLPVHWASLVAAESVFLHAADAWADRVPALTWGTESATILIIAILATLAASKTRRESTLARENARLAEERRLEAQRMKDLAEARQRLADQIEESKKERERFVDMVAHEIAGALTIVFGHAQMIYRPLPEQETSVSSAVAILAQTERLDRLMSDLRDAARVEHGKFRIQPAPCDLVTIVRGTVDGQQAAATDHVIELKTELASLLGEWDRDRIGQVLINLIRNAVAYSPKYSTVTVHVEVEDGNVRIAVTDQGIGIAPHDVERLFQPYARVAPSFSRVKGTGLGLYISKAIAEAHNGTIEVESAIGKGTTFSLVLPMLPSMRVTWSLCTEPVSLAAWCCGRKPDTNTVPGEGSSPRQRHSTSGPR